GIGPPVDYGTRDRAGAVSMLVACHHGPSGRHTRLWGATTGRSGPDVEGTISIDACGDG
ncbi:hypothetical protein ACLOJK_014808, partial [Asimina triloba]